MKKKSPRLQLNIRLTPEQNELIKQKLEQTQISKTQLIIDSINNNPIYIIPNLEQTISQIKYLGNKVNELSNASNIFNPPIFKLLHSPKANEDTIQKNYYKKSSKDVMNFGNY